MDTERAIDIFKDHLIVIRSGTDLAFPSKGWSNLIGHTVIMLTILLPSQINPFITTYIQVYGIFNINRTPRLWLQQDAKLLYTIVQMKDHYGPTLDHEVSMWDQP